MTDQEWLDHLKTGDKVLISSRFGVPNEGIVIRRTKTQIFVITGKYISGKDNETAFRNNGDAVQRNTFGRASLIQPTDFWTARIELAKLTMKAKSLHESVIFPKAKDELLQLIADLEKYQPVKPCQ